MEDFDEEIRKIRSLSVVVKDSGKTPDRMGVSDVVLIHVEGASTVLGEERKLFIFSLIVAILLL